VSLRRRLERLEEQADISEAETPRYLERYLKALENIQRAEAGEPPLPYTEEDREDDRRCLDETIPAYRAAPGWQSQEARMLLDRWERDIRARL
jgi:hypothetical protein